MRDSPDLLGLLVHQGEVTVQGIAAFATWSGGTTDSADEVRKREHEADSVRRELETALKRAFSTPIDAEDLYELSERLDRILNSAKNAIREAEVMAMEADGHMEAMARLIEEGVRNLLDAFGNVVSDPDRATASADAAIVSQRSIERAYRTAMSSLLEVDEVGEVIGRRELYRRYSRIGDAIVHVADRIWYSIVKLG